MGVYEVARKNRKKAIRDSFWKLYKIKEINRITVSEIAELAGIHRVSFYRYYQDVYQILEEIESELLNQLAELDLSQIDQIDALTALGYQIFNLIRNNNDYLYILLKEQKDFEFKKKFYSFFEQKIQLLFQEEGTNNSSLQESMKKLTSHLIVECFISCATNKNLTFEDLETYILGIMSDGFYQTLANQFALKNIIKPS
ncbi:TetR/AcrR family transcriptional regulator [Streptococcus gallolyticus]|uniref:TetR/AcrR family transcriptional regulator n=1 Tax=Streptococcus gallolyticus TaxID=315405 RepID=UPI002283E24A|nr:TetR/AcrR family transcriptional regulator [Streptococcus gallolyticus]MCY7172319.1 TetR/AcrR family transcriptional regulator [Streptococcus gallolyticus subsp. gallolyticus]